MPDLSKLAHDTAAEEIPDVTVPEGYWGGIIRSGKLYEKDSDGNALTDKNGDEYMQAVLFIECQEPIDVTDGTAAETYIENDGPRESFARYRQFIRGGSDIRKLVNKLSECGALTSGRSLAKILEELKGAQVPVSVLVEHEEYNGDTQVNATELTAAE